MEKDLAEHEDCPAYQDMKTHVKDLHEHVHDLLAHIGHVDTDHVE